ncbi:VIT-domain-containing protein [Astrocystis sublimbata]|nr:VIT-domain-containing protein [Astrocystis sublimbata]
MSRFASPPPPRPICGCWYIPSPGSSPVNDTRSSLPLQSMNVHAVIKDTASRTTLTQAFSNDSSEHLKDIVYSFPLYDGVSVVSFTATIGDVQVRGVVKEKQQARHEYDDAVNQGLAAGLLEQLSEASDIFVTKIGNVPAKTRVLVELVYIGELRHDAGANGLRFTIPSSIAPRYGPTPSGISQSNSLGEAAEDIQVTVDFQSPEGCHIQQIQSPSHPVTVGIGRTTDMPTTAHVSNRGFATLSLNTTVLDKDFIITANIKDADIPRALLETHETIADQRALVTTLVPRFNITHNPSEVVFIVDRSGSMGGKMEMVIKAMMILLKSLPTGSKFNIVSFGSNHSFLWPRSQSYNDASLNEALAHVQTFDANYGGTEMYQPAQEVISRRFSDMTLDAILLTDGEIWEQDQLFDLIREAATDNKSRFFSLGIGSGASTALVEGIATAGNGFSQFVVEGEVMDAKLVRLLKGALTPHIGDYSLEVKYGQDDEDFEIIETVEQAMKLDIKSPTATTDETKHKTPISFFDPDLDTESDSTAIPASTNSQRDKYAHLPTIAPPAILQAPCRVPPLYPFSRTNVYLLLDPSTYHMTPESIILRATCPEGPLELEIKVEHIGRGKTIHQLAARKAVSEIEKTGGWLASATDKTDGSLLKAKYEGRWDELVEREAVRLGVKHQVVGKWCSFVAVEGDVEREAVVSGGKPVPPPRTYTRAPLRRARFGASPPPPPTNYSYSMAAPTGFGAAYDPMMGISTPSQLQSMQCSAAPAVHAAYNSMPPAPYAQQHYLHRAGPGSRQKKKKKKKTVCDTRADEGPDSSDDEEELSESTKTGGDFGIMYRIVGLQRSDGSWECTQRLLDSMEINLRVDKQTKIVATALAIAYLQSRVAEKAEVWELVVDKAKGWLGNQDGVDVDQEIADAQKLL